jgi:hypothetical protein
MPRHFVFTDSSIHLSLYPILNEYCGELLVINFITFVLSRFRGTLFAEIHLFIWERTLIICTNHLKFLLEIMTLVSPANILSHHTAYILQAMTLLFCQPQTFTHTESGLSSSCYCFLPSPDLLQGHCLSPPYALSPAIKKVPPAWSTDYVINKSPVLETFQRHVCVMLLSLNLDFKLWRHILSYQC